MKAPQCIAIVVVIGGVVWLASCERQAAPSAQPTPQEPVINSDVGKSAAAEEVSAPEVPTEDGKSQPLAPASAADNRVKTASPAATTEGDQEASVGETEQAADEAEQADLAAKPALDAEDAKPRAESATGTQVAAAGADVQLQTREKRWPNGLLKQQWTVKVKPDGAEVKHGEWRTWYQNGQAKLFGEYVDDERNGLWLTWHENGQQRGEGELYRNFRVGTWIMWDEAGQQRFVANYGTGVKHGPFTSWDEDGNIIESGEYVRGKKHGTWITIGPQGKVETQWNQGEPVE